MSPWREISYSCIQTWSCTRLVRTRQAVQRDLSSLDVPDANDNRKEDEIDIFHKVVNNREFARISTCFTSSVSVLAGFD